MNARDMEDIVMNSRENLKEWRADYMRQYTEPVRKTLIELTARQLNSLPPQLKAVSRQRNPEEWKVLDGLQ